MHDQTQPGYVIVTSLFRAARSRSVIPKVQMMAAPVGRSHWYDNAEPAMLTPIPIPQPTKRLILKVLASISPQTAGTIKKEKIRRTPAT